MKCQILFTIVTVLAFVCVFLWSSTKISSSSANFLSSHFTTTPQQFDSHHSNYQANISRSNGNISPKLLCWIMTVDSPEHQIKSTAVKETWGKRCDKLVFVRNGTQLAEQELNGTVLSVPLDHEGRDELWHKVIAAFTYLHEHYLNEYEWFMKADDDTYVIVDALRKFLTTKSSPDKAVYFGYKFKTFVKQGYMSGGSGYVLSRQALKLLVEEGFDKKRAECHLKEGQVEDVEMGECLEAVKVEAGDTRDTKGRPTFLALSPLYLVAQHEMDKKFWYYTYAFYGPPKPDWILYDVKKGAG